MSEIPAWIAYGVQGPYNIIEEELNRIRENPNEADLIRPLEGPPLPPVVDIPAHAFFDFALPSSQQPPTMPPNCFGVNTQLAPILLGLGGPQQIENLEE